MSEPCPDIMELEEWVRGRMDSPSRLAVEGHLSDCSSCASMLVEVRQNLDLADRFPRSLGPARAAAPARLGDFQIVKELGRGGAGVVYEAWQSKPDRRVAIKVLAQGFSAGSRAFRLFDREIETLGMLRHPHIATLYSSGQTPEGFPYLVMEYIEGVTPRQYFAARPSPLRDRLLIFRQICDAMAYAHQRGVMHRDLKPGNILIQSEDRLDVRSASRLDSSKDASANTGAPDPQQTPPPTPKVLDFGLARIMCNDESVNASLGLDLQRLEGTLPYMSPEQTMGNLRAMDIRTDVYSLGVVLYEFLTGKLPYDVQARPLHEVLAVIRETAPTPPSTVEPSVRGDLEQIVLKSLSKCPEDRYDSAAALRDDLDRYLARQPVLARPPSALYQLRKLVDRHRLAAGLITALSVALLSALPVLGWLYTQAEEARARGESQTRKTLAVNEFLEAILRAPSPRAEGSHVTVLETLDDAAARIDAGQFRDTPDVELAVRGTLGDSFLDLGMPQRAEAQYRAALQLPHSAGEATEFLDIRHSLGDALREQDRWQESLELLEVLRIDIRNALGPQSNEYLNALAALVHTRARCGRQQEAEALAPELLELTRSMNASDPDAASDMAAAADALTASHQFEAAEPLYRRALEIFQSHGDLDHPNWSLTLESLCVLLQFQGRYEEWRELTHTYLEISRGAKGADRLATVFAYLQMTSAYVALGRFSDALPPARQALVVVESLTTDPHPHRLSALSNLSTVLIKLDLHEEAEKHLLAAMEMAAALRGENHPQTLKLGLARAMSLVKLGRFEEARAFADEFSSRLDRVRNNDPMLQGMTRIIRGLALAGLNQYPSAASELEEGWALVDTAPEVSGARRENVIRDVTRFYETWARSGDPHAVQSLTDWKEQLEKNDRGGRP